MPSLSSLLLVVVAVLLVSSTSCQPIHSYRSYKSGHQNILVIGETGSGKSTFVQYMLVSDVSKVDHSKISASVKSVTTNTSLHEAETFVTEEGHISATYYDTVGFNAEDIDSKKVFDDLNDFVKFSEHIHKVLIVHRVGRARDEVVTETKRTIRLLQALGAKKDNVYITLTFAYDYNNGVRNRLKKEVELLYKDIANPPNIFYSYYVLLSEITQDAQPRYLQRMQETHVPVLKKMLESVTPFRPVVETFKLLSGQEKPYILRTREMFNELVYILLSIVILLALSWSIFGSLVICTSRCCTMLSACCTRETNKRE